MKFFRTLESLRVKAPSYGDPFILQWEIPVPRDECTRMYIVFDGIKEYMTCLKNGKFNSCHEVFISSSYGVGDEVQGHPAFDIDIHVSDTEHKEGYSLLSPTWQEELQEDIKLVLSMQYPSSNIYDILSDQKDISPWVWMSSNSKGKISKHLTISNLTFITWRSQMKLLFSTLKSLPEDKRKSSKLVLDAIDDGICRKAGSLRLPLNRKIRDKDGNISNASITLDNPTHNFTHGVVLIHQENLYTVGAILGYDHLAPEYQEQSTYIPPGCESVGSVLIADEGAMSKALIALNSKFDTGLIPGKVSGGYMSLNRSRPGICPISCKIHESDNAYLFMKGPIVYFGCHRGCVFKVHNVERKYIDITAYNHLKGEDIMCRELRKINIENQE